jgi:hypothetical protein
MGATNRPHDNRQDKLAALCRRSGKMAVLTRCGYCERPVVGVLMGKRGRYCMECKDCGYSATSRFTDGQQPADDLGKA